jgi:hypothetical protein
MNVVNGDFMKIYNLMSLWLISQGVYAASDDLTAVGGAGAPPVATVVVAPPAVQEAAACGGAGGSSADSSADAVAPSNTAALRYAQAALADGYPALFAFVDKPKIVYHAASPQKDSPEGELIRRMHSGETTEFNALLASGADVNLIVDSSYHRHPVTLLDYCLDTCYYGYFTRMVLQNGGRIDLLSDRGISLALNSVDTTKGNLLLEYKLPLARKIKISTYDDAETTVFSLVIDRYYRCVSNYNPRTGGRGWCIDTLLSPRHMNMDGLTTTVGPSGKLFIDEAIELAQLKEADLERTPPKHVALIKAMEEDTLHDILKMGHIIGDVIYVPSLVDIFKRVPRRVAHRH